MQAQSHSCEQRTELHGARERIHSEPYNAQFVSTGRWFRVTRHIDVNGVELIDIKPYGRFDQIPYEVSEQRCNSKVSPASRRGIAPEV